MTRDRDALAGALESSTDAYGQVERRYAADVLLVPPVVALEGDRLAWRLRPKAGGRKAAKLALRRRSRADAARSQWNARHIPPGADMLRAFVKLADAPPERILAFARRWGPLGICRHKLPAAHLLDCEPLGWDGGGGWEPLERWRHYAARAQAALLVAHWLRAGGKGDVPGFGALVRDMAKVLLAAGRFGPKPRIRPPDWWALITGVVNEWIEVGGVRPRLLLSGDMPDIARASAARPRLVLTPTWRFPVPEFSLFGALGMQLAFAVSGERGIAPCSVCGTMFEPGRQLRPDESHYCDDCRASGAPQRAASAAYRARRRQKARAR
jgi:hypothetical protein